MTDSAPYDAELERQLLGSVLIGGFKTAIEDYAVDVEWFFDLRNQEVWTACEQVAADGGEVDVASVGIKCHTITFFELNNLADLSPSATNTCFYAESLRRVHVRRKVWIELVGCLTRQLRQAIP